MSFSVGYLVGSLAKGSINRKLAKALVRLAPPELELSEISFKELPLYSYDYDADFPPVAKTFKEAIAGVDAPSAAEPNDYRIATSVGPAFLARARSGAPTLLIPLDVAPVTVGRRGGGFSLAPATRVAFEYGGRDTTVPHHL